VVSVIVLVAALGVLLAVGLVCIVRLARGLPLPYPHRRPSNSGTPGTARQIVLATAVGVVVLLFTRWPAAALGAAALPMLWPRLFGGGAAGRGQLDRLEALASWTESLRDLSAASAGLAQAIPRTVTVAPPLLRGPLEHLGARLQGRVPLPEALSLFADEVDDPAADMVVAALILNSRQRGTGLLRTLSSLVSSARTELEMRRRVEHERGGLRQQAQRMAVAIVAFALLQAVFTNWGVPYSSSTGQLVLTLLIGIYVAAFIRLRSLAEPEPSQRMLTSIDRLGAIDSDRPPVVTS
jgi:tight adherence protein B